MKNIVGFILNICCNHTPHRGLLFLQENIIADNRYRSTDCRFDSAVLPGRTGRAGTVVYVPRVCTYIRVYVCVHLNLGGPDDVSPLLGWSVACPTLLQTVLPGHLSSL